MSIINSVLVLIEVILFFNLMIVVHEFGHFLAARWRGLHVERFGIWFGKPLWKRTINGVEYSLGSIPAGGFVALPQMAPMPESLEGKTEEKYKDLPPIKPLDKIIVAFAGPLFSFGLALVFAVIVWGVGKPITQAEASTVIGYVQPDGPAAKAGLLPGDQIIDVDGKPVSKFFGMTNSIVWNITRSEGATIPITVNRDGQILTKEVSPYYDDRSVWGRRATRQILMRPAFTPVVAHVNPDSVAAKAGLKADDRILEINGKRALGYEQFEDIEQACALDKNPMHLVVERPSPQMEHKDLQSDQAGSPSGVTKVALEVPAVRLPINVMPTSPADQAGLKNGDILLSLNGATIADFYGLVKTVHASDGQPLKIGFERNHTLQQATIIPQKPKGQKDWLIGISPDYSANGIDWSDTGLSHLDHINPLEQVKASVVSVFNTIGALISPKSDIKPQHLSGPVGIVHSYYSLMTSPYGWRLALWFSVILNVNLALINLFPIPVLDGGHITLACVEAIRGKAVNIRFLEIVQSACAFLIIGYMLYVTFYDVGDFAFSGRSQTLKFSPDSHNKTSTSQEVTN